MDNQDRFKQAYRCIPFSKSKNSDLEFGDKILMPVSALHELMKRETPYPWLFQIKKYYNPARVSHCGVLEFTADEGSIAMPDWMMENLNLQQGELVMVENAFLPAGKYMKLQPHSTRFIQLSNPKAVLEKNLRNFSCLSTGDTLMITHNDEKFFINILETKPGPAICLIGTDCEADFSSPLDYKEPEKPEKVEQNAPAEVQKKEIEERAVFRPFMGKGRRLDGETVETVKDDNLPTNTATSGYAGGSTALGSRKRRGTLVFGSNGVETKTQKRSSDDPNEPDTSEYASSDELRSVNSDSEEKVICYLEFNGEKDTMDLVLEVGLKFRLKEELKVVVKNFSISNRYEVVFPYNYKSRIEAR
ncbi:Ubiquitin fusion degradation UFD1 family protein [Forsythia ovata]|uniref:Ubiquitin fusion degradation UFD1 family protein n=1 Tax=Forsythia ovata TaxID=205694 RepID=A0ABD1WK85_9LAMI